LAQLVQAKEIALDLRLCQPDEVWATL